MSANTAGGEIIDVRDAPAIHGLRFRRFRGSADFPFMVNISNRSREADGIEEVDTVEGMARNYANLKNSDPYRDVVVVEVDGEPVAYKRVEWWVEHDGTYIYLHFGRMVPEWRGKGIGRALIRHSELRLREIALEEGHPKEPTSMFATETYGGEVGLTTLLKTEGYVPVRYFYEMVRPNLEDIPDLLLPDGIEVRPVRPEHYRAIWEAENEALLDHWGIAVPDEEDFVRWQNHKHFQPDIWQVAWDGDQVVGMVRNFILPEENEHNNRLRGYTEYITVRRPWRKRGIASALIARSFKVLKDRGMREAALGVDTENSSGALGIYEGLGFHVTKSEATWHKPME